MKPIHRTVLQMREQGKTYMTICRQTGLSVSSISYIVAKYFPEAKNEKIKAKNARAYCQSDAFKSGQAKRRKAANKVYVAQHDELMGKYLMRLQSFPDQNFIYYISGLYEGEGAHKGTAFDFCNSNPALIQSFLRFLREVLELPETRIKLRLGLHTSLPLKECLSFWQDICGREPDAVDQYDSRPQKKVHKHNKDRVFFGTLAIRVKSPNGIKSALRKYVY